MADPFEKLQKKSAPEPLQPVSAAPSGSDTPANANPPAAAKNAAAKPETGALQTQMKKGTKLSPKFVMIGCGIFFLLFL